jgi:transposase
MQTRKDRQEDLFVASPLRDLIPADHILMRVDAILDLSWLHTAVRECYCQDNGRPSIDPEAALRLMLAGFFQGIVHDRTLMREAQVNVAIRWFAGYRLDEALPERSSLTRIRQRWGAKLFRRIFERTVAQCVVAGLVTSDTVHIDATLIRADVSWDSLTTRHVEQVMERNEEDTKERDDDEPPTRGRGRPRTKKITPQKYSPTDPDATMSTSCKQYHLEPTYKQHTAVEDHSGVIVDVSVTTGQANEGQQLLAQLERIETTVGAHVDCVTCDAGYAHSKNYAALEERETGAIIPPPPTPRRQQQRIPARRFKYDAHTDRITCPTGKHLEPKGRSANGNGRFYRLPSRDCQACPLRERCISATAKTRQILLVDGYTALLRARRRKEKGWDEQTREKYTRHRWHVEGVHGRAKTQHGLARAARRGLDNVTTQVYLTAIVMNLKKLAATHPTTGSLLDAIKQLTTALNQSWARWKEKRQSHEIWIANSLQPKWQR